MADRDMSPPVIRVFIQARMSSSRFPGKVLAPFLGRPMISHVISRMEQVLPTSNITVATSTDATDDPLVLYVQSLGVPVFRGPLGDVFERMQLCLKEYPCDWFVRLTADSPLADGGLLRKMFHYANRSDVDLVTNAFPRSFPKGLTLEMLNASTFAGLENAPLSSEEREHMTQHYYANASRFSIVNLESGDPTLASTNLSVDTIEDMARLEGGGDVDVGQIHVRDISVVSRG